MTDAKPYRHRLVLPLLHRRWLAEEAAPLASILQVNAHRLGVALHCGDTPAVQTRHALIPHFFQESLHLRKQFGARALHPAPFAGLASQDGRRDVSGPGVGLSPGGLCGGHQRL